MRRAALLTGLIFALLSLGAGSAAASDLEVTVGGGAGYQFELEAPLVLLEARAAYPLVDAVDLAVQLQGNYFFVDQYEFLGATFRSTILQFDLNLLAHLDLDTVVIPYLGLGPALVHARARATSSNNNTIGSSESTDMGFNFVVGLMINSPFNPFVQARATMLDGETSISVMGGISVRVN